jgi:hypothetical protein
MQFRKAESDSRGKKMLVDTQHNIVPEVDEVNN